jgi:hypothetical protein
MTSDYEENRKNWFAKEHDQHVTCSVCCKKFRNQFELCAHELNHESELIFKCPCHNCTSAYKKGAELLSHMRKRHPNTWNAFE